MLLFCLRQGTIGRLPRCGENGDLSALFSSFTSLRTRAIAIAVELLDLQLQMGDQCLVVGLPSAGDRSLRASNDQCRFQRFDVVWQRFKTVTHGPDGITKGAI